MSVFCSRGVLGYPSPDRAAERLLAGSRARGALPTFHTNDVDSFRARGRRVRVVFVPLPLTRACCALHRGSQVSAEKLLSRRLRSHARGSQLRREAAWEERL